jgi:50S ribosomal protein uL3
MLKGLIGKKIGMTQIFDDNGLAIPVTLIEAGPCYVTQVRQTEKDGYTAVQLGFEEVKPKRLTGGRLGHLKRNELPPLRFLREFRVKEPAVEEGETLHVGEIFAVGERVDVIGTSKGKGFQGAVKRHGFAGGPQRLTASPTGSVPPVLGEPQPRRAGSSRALAARAIWALSESPCRTWMWSWWMLSATFSGCGALFPAQRAAWS